MRKRVLVALCLMLLVSLPAWAKPDVGGAIGRVFLGVCKTAAAIPAQIVTSATRGTVEGIPGVSTIAEVATGTWRGVFKAGEELGNTVIARDSGYAPNEVGYVNTQIEKVPPLKVLLDVGTAFAAGGVIANACEGAESAWEGWKAWQVAATWSGAGELVYSTTKEAIGADVNKPEPEK